MIHGLTVLGSGTLIPQRGRSCSAYLVEASPGPLLLDCGPGTLLRLGEAGVPVTEIGLLLISHFHWDHISDLPPLLNSRWLQGGGRSGKLTLVGPRGLAEWLARVVGSEERWLGELQLELREAGGPALKVGSLQIQSGRTLHTAESLCFRLTDEGGRTLFYSGDMGYNEGLLPLALKADLAVVECSWTANTVEPGAEGHLRTEQAARLAALAEVRQLLLTHFYHAVSEAATREEVARYYSGPTHLARDLERYPLIASPLRPGG
jgi:ribonuclease BN (tRNA processing enzyme)